jgi:hypothetical protein
LAVSITKTTAAFEFREQQQQLPQKSDTLAAFIGLAE